MKKTCIFSVISLCLGLVPASDARDRDGDDQNRKAVFVMTNSASHNEILSYSVQPGGSLKAYGRVETGGRGSGGTTDPLGSQGSLILSEDRSMMLAVNAGSGQLSLFRVEGPNLKLMDVQSSGGSAPVAVAEHEGLVYVLNFAGNSDVVGFTIHDGDLKPIGNSERFLSTANSGASSLAFSPDGKYLVVTEKLTNRFDVFPVLANGTLGPVATTIDPLAGLFEVVFAPDGGLLVLHTASATLSSYLIDPTGALIQQAALPTAGGASCWLVITANGKFVYTSNAGTANISGFSYIGLGLLSVLPGGIVGSYPAGSTNLDIAASGDSKYVYTLNSGTGMIGMEAVKADGTLTLIGTLPAFAAVSGANGIAAL
jgi:6-phosphogluconolactonase (cycloisomerase 2 family)